MARKGSGKCSLLEPVEVRGRATDHKFVWVAADHLRPHPKNPRVHTPAQIQAIAKSIEAFGYNAPIGVDKDNQIVAGHGRFEAVKLLGYKEVPVVRLDHLTEIQAIAYMLADNKLTDRSTWDEEKVAIVLKELCEIASEFEIEATGFEIPEIDCRIQSLGDPLALERADEVELASGPAVASLGDIWVLGRHKICCGNALEPTTYDRLFDGATAAAAFTDPPYNVPIDGHVTCKGKEAFRDFPMGIGEMSAAEFTNFLSLSLANICKRLDSGALLYVCLDWRHVEEMIGAGRAAKCSLLNLCVWVKPNGGMGSFYRSRHELIFVFRNGDAPHINNIQLGRFGRNRTNVWTYPTVSAFGRGKSVAHPTIKPISLVADAILDSTKRDDIVLDPYLGSGTTVLAAERSGRRCYGIELDPLYVDTAIERWQRMTCEKARTPLGETFEEVKRRRKAADE